jgi:DNA-directed RNA polymerase specialized sigma24 family protein
LENWDEAGRLLRAIADGTPTAWPALQTLLHPRIVRLARLQPIGRLKEDIDAAHEIAARVFERLHANDHRAIHRLFESERPPEVGAWIRVLVRTTAIDVMRQHHEFVRSGADRPAGWIELQSLVSSPGAAADSLVEKQRDVIRFVEQTVEAAHAPEAVVAELARTWNIAPLHVRRIVGKGATYVPILRLVFAGHSVPETATTLGFTTRVVELTLEYIEELLAARRFAQ